MNKDFIKRLKSNSDFTEFQKFILSSIDELNSVQGLFNFSNESAGEEVKVRIKAIEKLKDILTPFINFGEKSQVTNEQIKKKEEKYGL